MSEPTTTAAPPKGKGRKILGMSQGQLLIVLGVALVGGAFLLWRHRKSAQQAQQAPAAGTCPDGSQPDANGNCTQSSQDFSGQIATLQTEIADLQGALAGAGGAGGGGSGTVGGSTGTSTVPPIVSPPSITPPGSPPPGGGGPGWKPAGAISNLQQSGRTPTSVSVRWNPAPGATQGYSWGISQLNGGGHKTGTTKATAVTVGGLHPGWTYNFAVQALPGGPGNNIHVGTAS